MPYLFSQNIDKQWNLLISNIARLATNLQVPGEDFVLIMFSY